MVHRERREKRDPLEMLDHLECLERLVTVDLLELLAHQETPGLQETLDVLGIQEHLADQVDFYFLVRIY